MSFLEPNIHNYHFTRVSGNSKTGPIPVTTSSKSTCPASCPLMDNGCYADNGHLALHWRRVSDGSRGCTLDALCDKLRQLPRHQLWRWAQAGDLPGDGTLIDGAAMEQLTHANRNRQGFGFTHYDPAKGNNAEIIAKANDEGFAINLSADTLEEADEFVALGIAPVVVVLPIGTNKPMMTPAGNFVAICPATQRDDVQCANCGICASSERKAIVGFPAHGSGAKKAQAIFFQPRSTSCTTKEVHATL